MGERALGWGLRLLGIGLMIGPILAALAVYGASLDLIMPEPNILESIGELGGMMENEDVMKMMENQISITENLSISIPGMGTYNIPQKIEIPVEFTSPLDYVVLKFEDISGDINCAYDNVRVGSISLKEPVDAQPHVTCSLTLVADLSEAVNHYPSCSSILTIITEGKLRVNLMDPSITIYELTVTIPGQLGETMEIAF